MNQLDRIRSCLLAGAAGDALGAAVEFMDWPSIRHKFGERGIRDFAPVFGKLGAVTDDTQMMLFTAEGLLRAWVRQSSRGLCHPPSVIHHAPHCCAGTSPRAANRGWRSRRMAG